MAHRGGDLFPLAAMLLNQFTLGFFQTKAQIIESLLALVYPLHH
jgi:hypothetical protein